MVLISMEKCFYFYASFQIPSSTSLLTLLPCVLTPDLFPSFFISIFPFLSFHLFFAHSSLLALLPLCPFFLSVSHLFNSFLSFLYSFLLPLFLLLCSFLASLLSASHLPIRFAQFLFFMSLSFLSSIFQYTLVSYLSSYDHLLDPYFLTACFSPFLLYFLMP